LLSLPW